MDLVLGIDLGTHGARVLVVDHEGTIHAFGSRNYDRFIAGDVQEQPLGPVWQALCEAVHQAVGKLDAQGQVMGMAVTHQRGTIVALDSAGEPIGPAICDSDRRSWPQAQALQEQIGVKRLYDSTGCPPLPFNGLTKILWWKQNKEDLQRVARWCSLQDWAVYMLTGNMVSSPGGMLRIGVLDIKQWDHLAEDILDELGLSKSRFLPLLPYRQQLGQLSAKVAESLGLREGIPVFPSPGDQPAAVMGVGAAVGKEAVINLGTSFLISVPMDPFPEGGDKFTCTAETLPDGTYAVELGSGAGTNVLDWVQGQLFQMESIEEFIALPEASKPGSNGLRVLPFWWSALDEKLSGQFLNLRNSHTRADIVMATLEALACEMRWCWERMKHVTGTAPEAFILFGGASKSELLCQTLANVLRKPVVLTNTSEASCLGAAISAARGLGWFDSNTAAAQSMVSRKTTIEVDQSCADLYEDLYQDYLKDRPA